MSSLDKERMSRNFFSYGLDQYQVSDYMQKSTSEYNKNLTLTYSSALYKNPSFEIPNSKDIIFQAATTNCTQSSEEAQSVINFKGSNTQSILNFEQSQFHNYQWNQNINSPNFQAVNSSNYSCINITAKEMMINQNIEDHESNRNWFYTETTVVTDSFEKSAIQDSSGNHKRYSNMGESTQASKKQCTDGANKNKPKPKSSTQAASKDPQSNAAKNRRERISERLKVLQELVPNCSKVDLVTMLEKAISYVKFLQLQVKVLATDEFWPVQGGKPPGIPQVKEAIDAILNSSQKDTST